MYLLLVGANAYIACYRFKKARKLPNPDFDEVRDMGLYPKLLVQLPIYNEQNSVLELLDHIKKCEYPGKLVIQILNDSTDDTVQNVEHWIKNNSKINNKTFKHIVRVNRDGFKAGALKHGMRLEAADYIAIFDADFRPPSEFLLKAVSYLEANKKVGLLQGRWSYINENENIWTRFQAIGMDGHFAIEQPARAWNDYFMNFNGTAGIWRRKCIENAGGWQADTLTEDLDLSYRAQLEGWKLDYKIDLSCPSEIPTSVLAFKSQQFRWAKGSIQTAKKILPNILYSQHSIKLKIEAIFHLTHYMIHPLLLANFVIGCLILINQIDLLWPHLEFLFVLILIACAGPSYLYRFSQKMLNKKLPLFFYPLMISLGCGLAVNNSRGVFEALLGKQSPFVRTPKRGNRTKCYKASVNLWFLIELALGCFGLIILVHSPRTHFFLVPFISMYTIGFLSIGLSSTFESVFNSESQYKKGVSAVVSEGTIDANADSAYISEI
tara:strand:- start:612 stop:2090 length:1479 start_codon:yes stop_codon:yes gene_type:complete